MRLMRLYWISIEHFGTSGQLLSSTLMAGIAHLELAERGERYREPEALGRFSGSFRHSFGIPRRSVDEEDELEATARNSGRLDARSDGGFSSGSICRVWPAPQDVVTTTVPLRHFRGQPWLRDYPTLHHPFDDGGEAVRSRRVDDEQLLGQASALQPQPTVDARKLPPILEYLSHLAVFGMLGVLIRYGLQTLFGPKVAGVTGDWSALFTDLPANMVGSFFMGWVGVTLKKHISRYSEILAVGLSTGLMGSITTFASWIQHMLELLTGGRWVHALVGIVIGVQLSWMSLIWGINSARELPGFIHCLQRETPEKYVLKLQRSAEDHLARRWIFLVSFSLLAVGLWVASLVLTLLHVDQRKLWLACVVAPLGVWTRWHLARLNGQGVGPKHWIEWLPVGTLLANVIASWLDASLGTVRVVVDSPHLWLRCT